MVFFAMASWSTPLASACLALAALAAGSAPVYSPARPPSVPLAVRTPYTSAWSTTFNGSTLNSGGASFWTGAPLGWTGIVTVDGTPYRYLGPDGGSGARAAEPRTVAYDSQSSNFTFAAGPVTVVASFLSPMTPRDYCRSSIPLSYLTVTAESSDGQTHAVQFYSDVNAAWLAPSPAPAAANSNDSKNHSNNNSSSSSNNTDESPPSAVVWDLHVSTNTTGERAAAANASSSEPVVYGWTVTPAAPQEFGEINDQPSWGWLSYATSPMGLNLTMQVGASGAVQAAFVRNGRLDGSAATLRARAAAADRQAARDTVFSFSHDAGAGVSAATVRYTVGTVQTPMVDYTTHGALQPWWLRCYGDAHAMVGFHFRDFAEAARLAAAVEARLQADVAAYYQRAHQDDDDDDDDDANATTTAAPPPGSYDAATGYGHIDPQTGDGRAPPGIREADAYYAVVALSARQALGAAVYVQPPPAGPPDGGGGDDDDGLPLVFQKELSSDGNVNTVDVLFPALPFLLWTDPQLLRMALEPLFAFQEEGLYPNGYAAHDIGSRFPRAAGHPDGRDEYMPVEECGNMILMSYAYYRFSGDAAWLARHYALLKRWATYLTAEALVPAAQFSTDDFAGTLTNQTNLALKGILGLRAMASVARVAAGAGAADASAADAAAYDRTATDFYARWEALAVDPRGEHALLAYQWRSSWGLLYNAYADRLLDLRLVRRETLAMQSRWYPRVSQAFGVPLDNRHHYTKSDWLVWTAATCGAATRRLLITSLGHWVNRTAAGGPLTDLYETLGDGSYPTTPNWFQFRARPVVGGHFALLALLLRAAGNGTVAA